MANKKISELQSRTPALSDLMLVGDPSSGYSYKCTITALATIIETDIADGYVTIGTTQTISGAKTFSNNLTLTSVANATTTQSKFLTLNASNVVNYRTGAEVLADIGGQGTITLTTTGTSGAATLVGNTLNIPNYGSALSGYVPYTGATTNVNLGTRTITANGVYSTEGTYVANTYGLYGRNAANNAYNLLVGITGQDKVYIDGSGSGTIMNGTLTLSVINNATIDTDTFLVADSGVIKYRTGTQLLSDIGAASSSSISGTTNYIPKFTSSSAIGNSLLTDNGIELRYSGADGFRVQGSTDGFLSVYGTADNYLQFIDGGGASGYIRYNHTSDFMSFQTASSERMRLTSGGSLGIGTSNPSYKFQVEGGAGYFNLDGSGTTVPLYVNNSSTAAGTQVAKIAFASSGSIKSSIAAAVYGNDYMTFNVGSDTERMRLDASGNLGLGTSSPSTYGKLAIVGAGLTEGYTVNTSTTSQAAWFSQNNSGTKTGILQYGSAQAAYGALGGGEGALYSNGIITLMTDGSGYLKFATGGNTERMRLDASGNLGLGVTPSAWNSSWKAFQFGKAGSIAAHTGVNAVRLSSNEYDGTYISTDAATRYEQYEGQHKWYNAPSGTAGNAISFTQAMTLDASGNLLLGQTSSAYSSAGRGLISINGSSEAFVGFNTGGNFKGYLGHNGTDFILENQTATGVLKFVTNSSERMRITSGGLVGIGTSSPDEILRINGTNSATSRLRIQNNGTNIAFLGSYSGIVGSGNANDLMFSTGGNDNLAFGINTTEKMRLTSSGELLINTTSDAGDYKLQVNGNVYAAGNLDLRAASGTTWVDLLSAGAGSKNYRVTSQLIGVSNTGFGIRNVTDARNELEIDGSGNSKFFGSIQTAAPSGGTAKPWKLGEAGVTLGGSNTSGVRVEIDGVVYYLVTGYLP